MTNYARSVRFTQLMALAVIVTANLVCPSILRAQGSNSRFLAKEDILLYGIGLKIEPAQQTVPRDIATIVSTYLQAPNQPDLNLPPFAPNAVVMATLRGPSFATPLELTTRPNTPFNIPPLTVAGIHTLDDIRLVSDGQVLLRGTPESATINVIDKLLITQVTATPLTAAEIREKGIVFDKSNFQAYNFTAAFAVSGTTVNLNFPVLLPTLAGATDVRPDLVGIPAIQPPGLQTVRTIIPDTLKIQSQIPNLSVVGFTLKLPEIKGQNFSVPPIPGVIVFPGNIGFLNQFFSVLLMVSNVAPEGSNLVVTDLTASIVLPPGKDTVVGTDDDPLAMAKTDQGETPRVKLVTRPGPDGKLGTADDIASIGPGETGNAEYLVEGRREGSHVVEMELAGTLNGLPVGPVPIRGRATGAVLVRNPTYTLTFIHPDTVTSGEAYSLDVSVTNTSESPANFVSINLFPRNISGATLVGDSSKDIEFIAPGDSATVSFDLISRVTGKVTAATLDSDAQVAGRFELKHSVGELGVPLSPESLVLPREAKTLPKDLRDATLGLLGKAWAVATAPPAALPKDVLRFSRQMPIDLAVDTAEAGLRVSLHEPLRDSATQLAMDFAGSLYARLPEFNSKADDLEFAQNNWNGFDDLRRRSVRGDVFAQAVANVLIDDFLSLGTSAFHRDVAQKISYRPANISVLLGTSGAPLPVSLKIINADNQQLGGADDKGKILKQIPFSDFLIFKDSNNAAIGQLGLIATAAMGSLTIRLEPVPGVPANTPFDLSIAVPTADGNLRQVVFRNLTVGSLPLSPFTAADPYRATFSVADGATLSAPPSSDEVLPDPPPSLISSVQKADGDELRCSENEVASELNIRPGRVVALLFSEEVTPESVQDKIKAEDITNYDPEANRVVSVALQPGGRIAYLALRDPIGPFVPRQISVQGVSDLRGHTMVPEQRPMESTVSDEAGVVSGRIIRADGTPIPYANVRLFYLMGCEEPSWVGIASKSADADGRYSWDYVLQKVSDRIVAVDPESDEYRDLRFNIQRPGQRLNVDVVMLGRGTFKGRTLSESGTPLRNTAVRITSMTDQSQYGATTGTDGSFSVAKIPVGNILVEAVNTDANAKVFISENIPFAGATTSKDLVLLNVEVTHVTVKTGTVHGHVLRSDNATPVANVPVIAWYESNSQPGVKCPAPGDCAVAVVNTGDDGAYTFPDIVAGNLRIHTLDQATYEEGETRTILTADGTAEVNVLLVGGLATVTGVVLDPNGHGVPGASVGGGLSLTTTDANGQFTLVDVPVGNAQIVAVSQALGSRGSATVNISRAGEVVNATIVLDSVGGVGGVVRLADGATPAANIKVYLFKPVEDGITVVGTAITDAQGRYSISQIPIGGYQVSAFKSDFSDGNIAKATILFSGQVVKADVTFRGGGGKVTGTVFDDDGVTPLKARVSVSGDQLVIAGGQVGVEFRQVQNFKIVDTDFTTGTFTMGGLWVGSFTLRAAGQFSPDPIALEGTMPTAGATVQMDVKLQPTSRITGRVFMPDGVTPAGANVLVKYKSDEFKSICSSDSATGEDECVSIPQGIQEETAVTAPDGTFGFPIVNGGVFTISAEDPVSGRASRLKGNVRAGELLDVSLRLTGLGEVTVKVIGSDSTSVIPGAKVEIEQLDYPNKKMTAFADTTGTLVLGGGDSFSEGSFTVKATDVRNGFTGRASGKVVQDGDHVLVSVYLFNASGVVTGTVTRPDGITTVPNAEVVVSGGSGLPLAFTLTDQTGVYRVDGVPLGQVKVDVFEAATARRGFADSQIDFDHQEVPVNITEMALGVVRGTVLDATTLSALKGWQVNLSQTLPGGRSGGVLMTTSSVDGTFSMPGVSLGTFTMTARKDGISGSGSGAGSIIREGQAVDIPILATIIRPLVGTISGQVFSSNGAPGANSSIGICRGGCGDVSGVIATTTAGSDGTFVIPNQTIGRYEVQANAQGSRDSGRAYAQLSVDGETAGVVIAMAGVSQITGQVVRSDNSPAAFVQVVLEGSPSSGCGLFCTGFADANGNFTFNDVPAKTFTVRASDPVSGLKGVTSDVLSFGQTKNVRVVLEPTGRIHGRMLLQNLNPAAGVTLDLLMGIRHFFSVSGADGSFDFATTPVGAFTLDAEDSVGTGIATRAGTVLTDVDLGDVALDEAPPAVASVTPASGATGVPLNSVVRIAFTEKINVATINNTNVKVNDGTNDLAGTLAVSDGDAVVTFTPLSPLHESTRYSLRVKGVKDLVGKVMAADFVSSFTGADLTPASYLDISPAPSTSGVTIYSTVRVKFSEPIDPAKSTGPPIVVTGPSGAIDGRIDYLFGNTVVAFTPARPLTEETQYHVTAPKATDLAGNVQPQGLDYTFSTTDRTPPEILQLVGQATVVENGIATIVADVGTSHDTAFVDFFINDVFLGTSRATPFTFNFQAIPAYGHVGDRIKVSAVATDTSGNRGTTAVSMFVTVTADQPPVVSILTPAAAITAKNGDRITVTVKATDDLGINQQGYKAQTGNPQDAALKTLTPVSTDHTEVFTFNVPTAAAPGSTILIEASALDTKGQVGQAIPVSITVLDSVPPTVTITGASTGDKIKPGQQTTVVVSAQDLGAVQTINFSTTGITVTSDSRTLSPPQNSALTSFTFLVPSSARPGDSVTLHASAVDKAGNTGVAATVLLPVADTVPPVLTLHTTTGNTDVVPGRSVEVVADASDTIAVSRVEITGSGAFSFSDAKSIAPPAGDAHPSFTINVPDTLAPGAVLNLQARAFDTSNNASSPAFLSLAVKSVADVTLPSSTIVRAGESVDVTVALPGGAPSSGLLVTFATANASIATVTPAVTFGPGETSKTISVTGQSGGTVQISAVIQSVERASMTVAVQGGVVDGMVVDSQFVPVAGVAVTVGGGGAPVGAVTGPDGRFSVVGLNGPAITVSALDPVSHLRGFTSATMNLPKGFAHVNVVLIPAGSVHGAVLLSDGQTSAGAGVKVEIFAPTNLGNALGTTFTDNTGNYAFPLVTLGSYTIDATSSDGNRGRSTASVTQSGQDVAANVTFVGQGSVIGTVLSGGGQPVPTATMTFHGNSIFGVGDVRQITVNADGTFRFDHVFVGTFYVTASDPITHLGAYASGSIVSPGQVFQQDLHLASFGSVAGTVTRSDGTTTVPNASVFWNGSFVTTTDAQGHYSLPVVGLGTVSITVTESATRGQGGTSGTLATNGQSLTLDVQLLPQATVIGLVTDFDGNPVSGALFSLQTQSGAFTDTVGGTTGGDGTIVVNHVLAGNLTTISARKGALIGTAPDQLLVADDVLHITVKLEPTATISGTVFAPDGQTPAVGRAALVHPAGPSWSVDASVPLASDGTFSFEGLQLSHPNGGTGALFPTYQLGAYDAHGRLRALVKTPIALTTNGQVETRTMTFVGFGTVAGRVINPDSSSAGNLQVQVVSLNPDFGNIGYATTNAAGIYQVNNLAVGNIRSSTGDEPRGLLGDAYGQLTADGQVLTLDVLLQSNAVEMPVTQLDANVSTYDLQQDGSITSGTQQTFYGYDSHGAALLDVVVDGVANRFTGGPIGTVEDQGREVTVSQQGVGGLNVTRKVFVPLGGYFARYLELLSNPTASPITVDVKLSSTVRSLNGGTGVVGSSSGDNQFSVAGASGRDQWVVVDDADLDPFTYSSNNPPVAFAFDGIGGAIQASKGAFDVAAVCPFYCNYTDHLSYEWDAITVPAGATVGVMHFVAQEITRAGATAAAQRLVQLPPEALSGMSPDEIAEVKNFAIPQDGVSAMAPLPRIDGSVTATVFEGDGTTVVQNGTVYLKSNDSLFGRTYAAFTDAAGHVSQSSNLTGSYDNVVIPIEDFNIYAQHPMTSVKSPNVTGSFVPGEVTANAVISFSNTGILTGKVRRTTGDVVTGGTVQLLASGITNTVNQPIGADGSFRYTGVPAAQTFLYVTVNSSQGTALQTPASSTTVVAGQTNTFDVILPPLGNVTGTVLTGAGSPGVNTLVQLSNSGQSFFRSTRTDSSGHYTLTDVPVGSYTLAAYENVTNTPSSTTVIVTANQTLAQNFTLIGLGTLNIHAQFASGAVAASAQVRISKPALGIGFTFAGTTNASGNLTVSNFPVTSFVVQVTNPLNTQLTKEVPGQLTTNGEVQQVNVALPVTGTVSGTITLANGTPASGSSVALLIGSTQQSTKTTDASGNYSFPQLGLAQTYKVRAFNPGQTTHYRESTQVFLNDTSVLNVTLPAEATIRVTVKALDGTPTVGVRVQVKDSFETAFREIGGTTDVNGVKLVPGVGEGLYNIQILDAQSRIIGGPTLGQVLPTNQGQTLDLAITSGVILPTLLLDANGFRYDIQTDGELLDGSSNAYDGAFQLALFNSVGSGQNFNGASLATAEDNGREVVIAQVAPIFGLNVKRKIFAGATASDSYFARYLEVLSNPTASPITVSARINSNLGSNSLTRIVATSSGDTNFTIADNWLVTDDDINAVPSGTPTLAFVEQGPGGAKQLGFASLPPSGNDILQYQWSSVTIQPGQSVILMHFGVQEGTKIAATAAAQRLVQLPPEALVGLSAEERTEIINWNVPADGSSPLAPLPDLSTRVGTVSGHAFAGDGVTILKSASVTFVTPGYAFMSQGFATTTTNSSGQFSFSGRFVLPFTLQSNDPSTLVQSPLVNGTFGAGQTSATQDIVFSNTGIISGRVLRGGVGVAGAGVSIDGSGSFNAGTGFDGSYVITGVLPGQRTVSALSGAVGGSTAVTVVAGQQSSNVDITIGAGTISGRVSRANGNAVGQALVRLLRSDGSTYAQVNADVAGNYSFANVPLNLPLLVRAFYPGVSGFTVTTTAPVTVQSDFQVVTANVTFNALATALIKVVNPDGVTPISNAYVYVDRQQGNGLEFVGYTDGVGMVSVPNVVAPTFTAQAGDTFGNIGTVTGTVSPADDGGTVATTLVSTTIGGYISGTVFAADGQTPIQSFDDESGGAYVEVLDAVTGDVVRTIYSDSGFYVQVALPAGHGFIVRAHSPNDFSTYVDASGQFGRARGSTQYVRITLPVGVVRGIVRFANGDPVNSPPNVTMELTPDGSSTGGFTLFPSRSDYGGGYGIIVSNTGNFVLTAQDSDSGVSATVTGRVDDATGVTTVDVTLPPITSLQGTVLRADGTPAANVDVEVHGVGTSFRPSTTTDSDGFYFTYGVPVGPFRVQVCDFSGEMLCVDATSTAEADVPATLDVQLPVLGTVYGTVFDRTGTTPVSSPAVSAYQLSGPFYPDAIPTGESTSNSDGSYSIPNVPPGEITVLALDSQTGNLGLASGVLDPGGTAHIDVTLGHATPFVAHLNTAQYVYDFECNGAFVTGGVIGGQHLFAGNSNALYFTPGTLFGPDSNSSASFPCLRYAEIDSTGRQIVLKGGYQDLVGLDVTRKIFVPNEGEFARYLEVFKNNSSVPLTVTARVSGYLDLTGPFLADYAGTSGYFEDSSAAAVGFVFGQDYAQVVGTSYLQSYVRNYSNDWTVTIPPGETRSLMHFTVFGPPGIGLISLQYYYLEDLSDANALVGLTDEEKSSIVNFVLP